jgi:hypothetical protein
VLLAVLIGLGQVPAGASPAGPASPAKPANRADDVPPKEEPVPYVPELIDFGLLRDTLRERYKDTFAGLVNNGDDSITIYETQPSDELHAWVEQRFEDAAKANNVDPKLIPGVKYETAKRSLDSLFELKERITAATETLQTEGVTVEAVGLKDSDNTVVVGVSSPTSAAQVVLGKDFGTENISVVEWKLTNESDRFNDSAPWNGGDQVVSEGASTWTACTTGFGMHDANSGDHYVTTAGHCNTHFWWNTWTGFPIRDSSTLLGVTSGSVWNGVYFGYRVDTQKLITTGSSYYIWTQTATRRQISAPLDVAQGDPTCIDGSISFQRCGEISATDFGEGGTEYLVELDSGNTLNGDSGAPSWRESPFGPLAQGTHVGSLSTGERVELNIYAVMFFNGLALNTPSNP